MSEFSNDNNSNNSGNKPPFPPFSNNANNQFNQNFPPFPPNFQQPKKRRWWIPLLIVLSVFVGFFVVIALIIGSLFSGFDFESKPVKVSKNSVLYLNFAGGVQEYASDDNPFAAFSGEVNNSASFIEYLRAIELAKIDDNIKGIYISPKGSIGFAKSIELIEAIEDFKTSGKFVYAFIETGNEADYMNIVSADKIFMPTEGLIELNGFGTSALFMKGLYKKIGVNFHVQGFEDFKSAGDSYNKTKFSDSARYQLEVLIGQRYKTFVEMIAKNRNLSTDKVYAILANGVYTADSIKANGLIDEIISENNFKEILKEVASGNKTGIKSDNMSENKSDNKSGKEDKKSKSKKENKDDEDKLNLVTVAKYINSENIGDIKTKNVKIAKDDKQIAIINSVGAISSGKNSSSPFGGGDYEIKSGTFVEQLKKAREDKNVKVIILRIDSPGGSVIASDEMWEEIMKTKKVKPVIASMSDVAASGGYYMAMACNKIVAHPQTITGSIGVILAIPNFSELMSNLDITADTISTSPSAQFMNGMYAYTDKDKAQLYNLSKGIYYRFLSRVAESRNKTFDEIRAVAKGRVWSGQDAKDKGLVDELGGLGKAIEIAKAEIGIDKNTKVKIKSYPEKKDKMEELIKLLSGENSDGNESNSNVNGINKLARLIGMEASMTKQIYNNLPLEFKNQIDYSFQLLGIAQKEKAMIALPNEFYIR